MPEDLSIRLRIRNAGPDAATLHVLPTLWFRNTWSWGYDSARPELRAVDTPTSGQGSDGAGLRLIHATHPELGDYWLTCEGTPE